MRFGGIVMIVAALLVTTGCLRKEVVSSPPVNDVTVDGLRMTIELPKRDFQIGEQFIAHVEATNTTGREMKIVSRTGAPVYFRIWRHTGLNWEEVKSYPETSTMVMTTWTLGGKSDRSFAIPLIVEPDWPVAEILSISAELNGREAASPRLTFQVHPDKP